MLYVFDMGNVVIKSIEVLDQTIELLGVDAKEFLLDYHHYDHVLMDGSLSLDDYYKHVEHVFGIKVLGKPFSDLFNPHFNQPMVDIIKKLKTNGNRVVCGSNTYEPHWTVIQNKGLDKVFDKCYLSHEIGLTKPSKAFFNYILEQEHVDASDVFFTDDYLENIETAQSLGINTFWYKKGFDDSKLESVYF